MHAFPRFLKQARKSRKSRKSQEYQESKKQFSLLEALENRLLLATYAVPLTIPHDYSRDVTTDLQNFFNSVPDNSTIAFPSLSYNASTVGYKVEGTLTISARNGLDFEGNGAFIRAFDPVTTGTTVQIRTRSQWRSNSSSTNLIWRNFTVEGANSQNPADYASGAAYVAAREAQHAFDIVGGSSNILLENNTIAYTLGDGIYIGGSNDTQFVTAQNNHIQYTGRQGMAPCQGHDILIQNNWIGDGARGLIDVEPATTSWVVDNIRILSNTFGKSHLLCMPMGGGGYISSLYVANNIDTDTNINNYPKIYLNATAPRRGPFIAINNTWQPATVNAPGFLMQPVDGMFIAGNDINFDPTKTRVGVNLVNSKGLAVVNNIFENATADYTADANSSMVMDVANATTRANWSRQTVVTEFAGNPGAYSATAPDGAGGKVIAIWRVNSSTGALTYSGLSTTGDFAVVHVSSTGGFIEGWGFDNSASYNGQSLTLLRGTQTNQPPVVNTFTPTPGTVTVGQSINLVATASDPNAGDSISAVKFFEGNTLLGNGTLANGQWSFNWNTTGHGTGSFTLSAIAYDASSTPSAAKTAGVTINPSTSSTQLTGTVIGTAGSWNNSGNTRDKALDGNTSTYFDSPDASANNAWVGLDLGSAKQISKVRYYPRASWAGRMVGGKFQGSNDQSSWTDLATITTTPPYAYSELAVSNTSAFRYVRYLSPAGGYGNVAEVEFYGSGAVTSNANPNAPSNLSPANSATNQSLTPTLSASAFSDPDAGDSQAAAQWLIKRSSDGATIFDSGTDTVNKTSRLVPAGVLANGTLYNWQVRYQDNHGAWSNYSAATSFTTLAATGSTKLSGTIIGTAGSFAGSGNTRDKALDGNTSTYFDASIADGVWVGLDLGTAKPIGKVRFYPRSGQTGRMVGGKFQGSNDLNSWTDLATISSLPSLSWNELSVSNTTAYRYVRYLSPNGGWGNVAEVEFYSK